MKALILAAGLGSRLKHKTADQPKALTDIAGKTILERQVRALLENEVSQIAIVLGYQGDKIKDFMAQVFPGLEVTYYWNQEFLTSNSSYSFWNAKEWVLGGPYLHLNCDIIFSTAFLKRLIDSPYENLLSIRTDYPLADRMENVQLAGDKIVKMAIETFPEAVGKAFGLAKLSADSSKFIEKKIEGHLARDDKNQNYYGIIREAIHSLDYYGLDAASETLLEVNTLDDFATVTNLLNLK